MHVKELPHQVQLDKVSVEVGFPFTQITGILATQAILESVGSATRLHIIDFTGRCPLVYSDASSCCSRKLPVGAAEDNSRRGTG